MKEKPAATSEDFFAERKWTIQKTDLSINGKPIYVREMNGPELDQHQLFVSRRLDKDNKLTNLEGIRTFLLVRTISDEKGKRIFSDKDMDKLAVSLPGSLLEQIYDHAHALNKLGSADEEETVKNSEAAKDGASGSS